MSRDAAKIFSGPGEITLYDASNGYNWLGYVDDIDVRGKALYHDIIDGNRRYYGQQYDLRVELHQSDQALLDDLVTRAATRQTIYIVGLNNMVTLSNMFIAPNHDAPFDDRQVHLIELRARTKVAADMSKSQSLLGTSGKMETFTGGVADSWSTDSATASSGTSHLSGGGNEQRITLDTEYFRQDVTAPFEIPRRITASAYVIDRSGSGVSVAYIGFVLLDSAGSVISTHEDTFSLGSSASGRQSYTAIISPSEPVAQIRAQIREPGTAPANIGIDNFQLQFGRLTAFADN